MIRNRKMIGTFGKAGSAILFGTAAFIGMGSTPANAAGTGNTVNNCYGVYFNTDWNQECGSTGASAAGNYHSIGDCTGSADRTVDRRRSVGDRTSVDGGDCRFQVINVRTSFS